jgi:hypothetical protein
MYVVCCPYIHLAHSLDRSGDVQCGVSWKDKPCSFCCTVCCWFPYMDNMTIGVHSAMMHARASYYTRGRWGLRNDRVGTEHLCCSSQFREAFSLYCCCRPCVQVQLMRQQMEPRPICPISTATAFKRAVPNPPNVAAAASAVAPGRVAPATHLQVA